MNRERRTRASIALALAAATSSGTILTGCNAVLDTGAYKVGTIVDGGSTDAESVPDAGNDGSTLVDTGAGIDTGVVEDDSGPDGGEEASCGPSGLPTTSATFKNVVTACVLAASCDPFLFQVTISQCISEDYLQSVPSPADSCLSTISSCADYAGCANQSIPTAAQCPSSSTVAYCDASHNAINCGADSNWGPYVKNCAARGQACGTYMDGAGTVADCIVTGAKCTEAADGTDYCDTTNNALYTCAPNGTEFGDSCNPLNAKCLADPVNGTSCYFNGTTCTTQGYTCAANDTAEWCTSNNVLFKFNCSNEGLTCGLEEDGSSADCLAPGCQTSDYDNCAESCSSDGHTGYVCVGGAQFPIDCKDYGFTTCFDTMSTSGIYCE